MRPTNCVFSLRRLKSGRPALHLLNTASSHDRFSTIVHHRRHDSYINHDSLPRKYGNPPQHTVKDVSLSLRRIISGVAVATNCDPISPVLLQKTTGGSFLSSAGGVLFCIAATQAVAYPLGLSAVTTLTMGIQFLAWAPSAVARSEKFYDVTGFDIIDGVLATSHVVHFCRKVDIDTSLCRDDG